MKLALIGDPHFANRKMFGRPTGVPGVNTRLRAVRLTLDWIAQDLKDKEVDQVVILGDITHDHGRLTPPVLNEVEAALWAFEDYEVRLLSGNHDQDANGLSIIGAFDFFNSEVNGSIESINTPQELFSHQGYKIHGIPYCSPEETMQYIEAIKGKACMLLMHHTFDGAVHGAHQFTLGGISPKYIPDYMQVYSGHIHMRQRIKQTIVYTGAPLQHDFGEAGYEPGYVIVDLDGDPHEYTFYPVPEDVAPRFHILPHNLQLDEVPGHERQDYYRIDLPTDVDPREISELVCELDNVMVKPIPIDSDTRSRVEEHLGEKGEKVDFFDVMAAYAAMKIDDTERAERIYAIGEDIATSVLPEAE